MELSELFAELTERTTGASHTIHRNKKIKKWVITFPQYLVRDYTNPKSKFMGYTVAPHRIEALTFNELMELSIKWIESTAVKSVLNYTLSSCH